MTTRHQQHVRPLPSNRHDPTEALYGNNEDWMADAKCAYREPEDWFPYENPGRPTDGNRNRARARQLCEGCPVITACLEYAMRSTDTVNYGIYGGTTPLERRRMSRGARA